MEDDQNVRIEKAGVTDKSGPQIWTRGKILIKRCGQGMDFPGHASLLLCDPS